MKSKRFSIIIAFLILQSCCLNKGEEIDRILFSVEDKAIIPYADNQTVNMITDDGFQFQLVTGINSSLYSDQEHCEDYTSYEIYRANLSSNLPNLDIQLRLNRNFDEINDEEFVDVEIVINRINFQYDRDQPLETIDIEGINYTDVFRYTSNFEEEPISEVLFNETNGILMINYLNGDYVQINQ